MIKLEFTDNYTGINISGDYEDYQDYLEMKIYVEKYCEENNCLINDVRTCEYPEELEW